MNSPWNFVFKLTLPLLNTPSSVRIDPFQKVNSILWKSDTRFFLSLRAPRGCLYLPKPQNVNICIFSPFFRATKVRISTERDESRGKVLRPVKKGKREAIAFVNKRASLCTSEH